MALVETGGYMKYQWQDKPPAKITGVASERANVWPKPVKESLKYAYAPRKNGVGNVLIAIGQLKNGRWEIYLLGWWITGQPPSTKIHQKWMAQSRMCKEGYRVGYSNYQNAYRSITQHLKEMR